MNRAHERLTEGTVKKTVFLCIALVLVCLISSCADGKTPGETDARTEVLSVAGEFSWDGALASYSGITGQGVIRDGFFNVEKTKVNDASDALRLALNEHKLSSGETYSVFRDGASGAWLVSFYPKDENVLGGTLDVYLNGDGQTLLMVAGE